MIEHPRRIHEQRQVVNPEMDAGIAELQAFDNELQSIPPLGKSITSLNNGIKKKLRDAMNVEQPPFSVADLATINTRENNEYAKRVFSSTTGHLLHSEEKIKAGESFVDNIIGQLRKQRPGEGDSGLDNIAKP